MTTCGSCGERNPARAWYCLGCGCPLRVDRGEATELVTVLRAHVAGSAELAARYSAEHYGSVLAAYVARMRAVVEAHGGTLEEVVGDAVTAVFGLPSAHEDDPSRAVRAAVEIDRLVADRAAGAPPGALVLRWRVGISTGKVSAGGPGTHAVATGEAVDLAVRLEQAAGPAQMLIDEGTHERVRDEVQVERRADLGGRGASRPVVAYRLLGLDEVASDHGRRSDQPFVGREEELALLDWISRRSLSTPAVQLVHVSGPAGVGKTQLLRAALDGVSVPVAWGRCLPDGEGSTYGPFAEALASAAGIAPGDDPDRTLSALERFCGYRLTEEAVREVAASVGLVDGPVATDVGVALERYLTAVAADDGLVLVLDDLHDAEPALLDAIVTLAEPRPAPLLLVAIARPELLQRAPDWAGLASYALGLSLPPLDDAEAGTLVGSRLSGTVDVDTVERLTGAAAGNPRFLEELITVLQERGRLGQDGSGRWSLLPPEGARSWPGSIHALAGARVDGCRPEDRRVLGAAAVCGVSFTVETVAALLDEVEVTQLAERLERLADRDLLERRGAGYAFRHRSLRDAVYAGLSGRRRTSLHERYVAWLDTRPSSPHRDEVVAYHLGRALTERSGLEPWWEGAEELRDEVVRRSSTAGERALARGDVRAADRFLRRAAELTDEPRVLAQALAARGHSLADSGQMVAAMTVFDDALAAAIRSGDDEVLASTCLAALWASGNLSGWVEEAWEASSRAIDVFTRAGKPAGLARAWGLRAEVHHLLGAYGDAAAAAQRAEALALEAGEEAEAREHAVAAVLMLLAGGTPLDEVELAGERLSERYPGDEPTEADLGHIRALMWAMRGHAEVAHRALAGAVTLLEELGLEDRLATSAVVEGQVETLLGARASAAAALRRGLDALDARGDRAQAALAAAQLACVLPAEQVDELAARVAYAEEHAHPDDVEAQVRTELARAHLAVARGDQEAALASLDVAVTTSERTDAPVLRADAYLARSRARRAAGSGRSADEDAATARALYLAKQHQVGAGWAEMSLLSAEVGPRAVAEP